MFYHDIKEHLSPSALAQWLNGRGQFVRSYFAGEKSPETKAMTAGTEIHALIEAGIIKAQHTYDCNEQTLKIPVGKTNFWFLGKPDSFESEPTDDEVSFVDYKSGKANEWEKKLPTDIKMRATAWLVWRQTGMPSIVNGHIEFIQTTWDPEQKKVIPMDDKETEVISIAYTATELENFEKVIANAMRDINDFYEKWKVSSGEFVNQDDVQRYIEIKNEIAERELELAEVGSRIQTQMEFGGEENHKISQGSFFITERCSYEYPKDLPFIVDGVNWNLEQSEKVVSAAKAAKSNYELVNEPKTTVRNVQFRAKKL